MNQLERLRDELVKRFPNKTIAVACQAYYHGVGVAKEIYTEYVISIDPGFDFSHQAYVQNFGGKRLQECLDKLNEAAKLS